MKVVVYPYRPKINTGNIRWNPAHPMRAGKFPKTHPVSPGGGFGESAQAGQSDSLEKFRARGYWASCFPEGDGITFYPEPNTKTDEETIKDIEECFGFAVTYKP